MPEIFISEPITPAPGTPSGGLCMAAGEPVFPAAFLWREELYQVAGIIEQWKEAGACRNGSRERYLRKHWYRIKTTQGQIMTLYFERQPRSGQNPKARWWLYTLTS